jgi:hypothetical protein
MRALLTVALVTLLVIAHVEHDIVMVRDARAMFHEEAASEMISLREDTTALRLSWAIAPAWMLSQWKETSASFKSLRADAKAEARRLQQAAERASDTDEKH